MINIGDIFGKLIVVRNSKIILGKRSIVKCNCGTSSFELSNKLLINKYITSCYCSIDLKILQKIKNRISDKYGKLKIIGFAGKCKKRLFMGS